VGAACHFVQIPCGD